MIAPTFDSNTKTWPTRRGAFGSTAECDGVSSYGNVFATITFDAMLPREAMCDGYDPLRDVCYVPDGYISSSNTTLAALATARPVSLGKTRRPDPLRVDRQTRR
jgi:hypothetical protein